MGKLFTFLAMAVLCFGLVSAQATINGTLTLVHEDVVVMVNITAPIEWIEPEAIVEKSVDCTPLQITGLPQVIQSGEKVSYSFTPWLAGDAVTYWVENSNGEEVKSAVTTTTKTPKQYTPKTEKEEQAFIFKAERQRAGCNESVASEIVVVQGEGIIAEVETCLECAECEACVCEEWKNPITSAYVLAKNYNEEILLHGNSQEATHAILFGEETPREVDVPKGKFSLTIHPVPGENIFGLVPYEMVVLTTFSLEGDIIIEDEEENVSEINTTLQSNYTFEAPLTGSVVLENESSNTSVLIAGAAGIAGIGVVVSGIKRKHLRNNTDSKNTT